MADSPCDCPNYSSCTSIVPVHVASLYVACLSDYSQPVKFIKDFAEDMQFRQAYMGNPSSASTDDGQIWTSTKQEVVSQVMMAKIKLSYVSLPASCGKNGTYTRLVVVWTWFL